jgi:hypothetical protein
VDHADETLEALGRLAAETSRAMRERATREDIEPRRAELTKCFDAMAARIPRGEDVPMDALAAMLKSMQAASHGVPFDLLHGPLKYVRGAEPVFRWSQIMMQFAERLDELRYAALASANPRACDCLVLASLGWNSQKPRSPKLRSIGRDWDGYYDGAAYACDECGTRWSHSTEDTESQHVEWWEPHPPTWEPSKPPAGS